MFDVYIVKSFLFYSLTLSYVVDSISGNLSASKKKRDLSISEFVPTIENLKATEFFFWKKLDDKII